MKKIPINVNTELFRVDLVQNYFDIKEVFILRIIKMHVDQTECFRLEIKFWWQTTWLLMKRVFCQKCLQMGLICVPPQL